MHQSVFELIHSEDQQEFRRNLHWALSPPHAPEGEPSPEGRHRLGSRHGQHELLCSLSALWNQQPAIWGLCPCGSSNTPWLCRDSADAPVHGAAGDCDHQPLASLSAPIFLSPAGRKSLGSSAATYKPDQLPPENSSFLERSFVCRFRCLLDNSSGFLVSTGLLCSRLPLRASCCCWSLKVGLEGPGALFCRV